jgi:hypothetical protein
MQNNPKNIENRPQIAQKNKKDPLMQDYRKKRIDRGFEWVGFFVGCSASLIIVFQILAELKAGTQSSLSPLYVAGFLLVFIFWTIYGFWFRRPAISLTNLIAAILQASLLIIRLSKTI